MIVWNINLQNSNAKMKHSAVYLVATAADRDSDVGSYSCLHHSLNGYFFCVSAPSFAKEETLLLIKS